MHEHNRYGPQGYDGQEAHKWVDPYCSSSNVQLKWKWIRQQENNYMKNVPQKVYVSLSILPHCLSGCVRQLLSTELASYFQFISKTTVNLLSLLL